MPVSLATPKSATSVPIASAGNNCCWALLPPEQSDGAAPRILMPYDHVHNRPVNVALVQMSCTEAKEPNVEKAAARIAEAAWRGANVVCLQELFAGEYFCQTEDHRHFDQAEPIPGPTSQLLGDAARKHGIAIIGW